MKKYVAIVFVLSVFWLSAQEISDSERLQKTILHLNEKHGNEFIQDEWKIKVKKQRVVDGLTSRRVRSKWCYLGVSF